MSMDSKNVKSMLHQGHRSEQSRTHAIAIISMPCPSTILRMSLRCAPSAFACEFYLFLRAQLSSLAAVTGSSHELTANSRG
jgi:hypothetical protein